MKEDIRELLELQKVDLELDRISLRKKEIPLKIDTLKKDLEKEEEKFEEFLKALKAFELRLNKKNVDLETYEGELQKYLKQLLQLKSNEEYARMQHQIELQKEKITVTEDEAIDMMEKIEEMKLKRPKEEERLRKRKEKIFKDIKELEKELLGLDDRILQLQDEKNSRKKRVPKFMLAKYEKLRQVRGGAVIVPVENGTCGGCHVALPIQVINDLKTNESFAVCENCGRLLYWPGADP